MDNVEVGRAIWTLMNQKEWEKLLAVEEGLKADWEKKRLNMPIKNKQSDSGEYSGSLEAFAMDQVYYKGRCDALMEIWGARSRATEEAKEEDMETKKEQK